MIEAPKILSETPGADRPPSNAFDVLSDVLRVVRMSGAVLLRGAFSAPWAFKTPHATEIAHMLLPAARQLLLFHLVTEGRCWIEIDGCDRLWLETGDIVALPYGDVHTMGGGSPAEPTAMADLFAAAPTDEGWAVIVHGGGGTTTRLICGFLHCDELLFNPLCKGLPSLLHVPTANEPAISLLAATVRHFIGEVHAARPGSACLLTRLAELLFIEILRRHMTTLPADAVGWLGALNDPLVGRALRYLHANPARGWTVESLAREVGASRTLLAARFAQRLDQPPMHYLTCWRLQLAAELLRDGVRGMAPIAERVGYASESAFNRAFKRHTGESPAAWRTRTSGAAA